MTIPSTATLKESEWKSVLKDKACKNVEKTGISAELRDYEKQRKKDLVKAGAALSELKKKIKEAQKTYAGNKPLDTYLEKLYRAAQDEQAAIAVIGKTLEDFRSKSVDQILADKQLRQVFKAYARKALFADELDFYMLAMNATNDTIKEKIWGAYIKSQKVDVSKHQNIGGESPDQDLPSFLQLFDAIVNGFRDELGIQLRGDGLKFWLSNQE